VLVVVVNGCSEDETPTAPPPPGGKATTTLQAAKVSTPPNTPGSPYWSGANWFPVTSTPMSVGRLYGDGQLNMSGTYSGTTDFNGGNDPELTLKAAYDNDNMYILAEWTDSDFDVDRRRWLFNGPTDPLKPGESAVGWTSQLNDDKLGLCFEIDAASSGFGGFAAAGCAASCHDPGTGVDMRPQAGKVDIWHWKTSRSEPLGYINDQFSDPAGRKNDTGGSIENRNRPAGGNDRSGPAFEWDGTPQLVTRSDGGTVSLDPAYILFNKTAFTGDAAAGDVVYQNSCAACHGASGQGASGPAVNAPTFTRIPRADLAVTLSNSSHPGATAYNGLSSTEQTNLMARLRGFSGIPGYYLTQPTGSQADVKTVTNVSLQLIDNKTHATYRLLMIRKLQTGNADDVQFDLGQSTSYKFGVALMDNDGRNHIGSRVETLVFVP
jgi:hypothetical protein